MKDDKQLRRIVNLCPLINADGASVVWAAKKLGVPLKERVTGIDLFENLIKLANDKGYKIYLFGAKEEVVVKLKNMFKAFSSPKKEYWVNKYLKQFNIPFVMGVGGSFDVMTGVTNRAPIWMQNHGLEWFYRFIQEPRRLWKRYIIGNWQFVKYTYTYKKHANKEG